MHNEEIVQTFLFTINQIATEQKQAVNAGKDTLISSGKVLDIGKEMVLPNLLGNEAQTVYGQSNTRMYNNFPLLCETLLKYLVEKEKIDKPSTVSNDESFKYSRTGPLPLQFSDFFIVEQAYMVTQAYLDYTDDYGYEYDGLVKLSSKVAIYMFQNMTREYEHQFWNIGRDLDKHPGGYYKFKEGSNLISFIESQIPSIEDIWEYEDEDEDND